MYSYDVVSPIEMLLPLPPNIFSLCRMSTDKISDLMTVHPSFKISFFVQGVANMAFHFEYHSHHQFQYLSGWWDTLEQTCQSWPCVDVWFFKDVPTLQQLQASGFFRWSRNVAESLTHAVAALEISPGTDEGECMESLGKLWEPIFDE